MSKRPYFVFAEPIVTLRTNSQKANKKITDQFLDNSLKTTYFRKMMMKMTSKNLQAGRMR